MEQAYPDGVTERRSPMLNQENVRRLNETLVRIGADLHERAADAGKQAGELLLSMAQANRRTGSL
jgi:hypothetical protein